MVSACRLCGVRATGRNVQCNGKQGEREDVFGFIPALPASPPRVDGGPVPTEAPARGLGRDREGHRRARQRAPRRSVAIAILARSAGGKAPPPRRPRLRRPVPVTPSPRSGGRVARRQAQDGGHVARAPDPQPAVVRAPASRPDTVGRLRPLTPRPPPLPRSRYVYDMYYRYRRISKELYEWCLREVRPPRRVGVWAVADSQAPTTSPCLVACAEARGRRPHRQVEEGARRLKSGTARSRHAREREGGRERERGREGERGKG